MHNTLDDIHVLFNTYIYNIRFILYITHRNLFVHLKFNYDETLLPTYCCHRSRLNRGLGTNITNIIFSVNWMEIVGW